ncbi:2-oxoacid:ferredoxin oxidoreductase subunit beta [Bdellovibrionota bacterium]
MSGDKPFSRKDFLSSIDPRWCPGCGCYGVIKSLTSVFSSLNMSPHEYAVVSGIGCSSRFPYYLSTYGFHTLHGRAPTVALGIKMTQPDLSVWVMTGDGDALSIGGNHFMHFMRRNADIKMILFNNRIYGLTKGQASPTTELGFRTKSTPWGSTERPVQPTSLAIAAGATFVARVSDRDPTGMKEVLEAAAKHKGSAMIEVLVNCVIFHDGVYEYVTDKEHKAERTIWLRHGEPVVFGKNQEKGLILHGQNLQVVDLVKDKVDRSELIIHDTHTERFLSYLLSALEFPKDPFPFGIFRQVSRPTFGEILRKQGEEVVAKVGKGDIKKLLHSSETWEVE